MSFSQRVGVTIPILWLGFVLSISFMEAWLKFQAEGVTQVIGLSIGRLVFGVLNKVELFFMIALLFSTLKAYGFKINKTLKTILISLLVILLAQTFYLLPMLDQRAVMIIDGTIPDSTYLHFYYVFLELLKVILLAIFSHQMLSKYKG
ncbi:hypothetical protein pgond44_11126 [Psychroflexus gondwanensis ACAM 44]|jgi:hypothetical protein|uniref:DUF4149 domain-containing protein n=1 Tax=Psychroflexus gondwanensis ACAM 44 TaxID=1189619 RepID=N1WTL5_9FLAO|nr:hypothetical protein [Psychroflexus gondwanensis]EMY80532.1 hypothetical protein pgond44_11126 [Psychroflexus gondwanensis ACAM 44]